MNESSIGFSWSAPEPELQNGAIIQYRVCIREYGIGFTCTRTALVPANDQNSYTYGGLNPVKEYVVSIEAATKVGFGPPGFIQKTSGKEHAVTSISYKIILRDNHNFEMQISFSK